MRKYSLGVIALYVLLTPLFIFSQSKISYDFSYQNLPLVSIIFLFSFFSFLSFSIVKASGLRIKSSGVVWAILYGLVIAVPEEIIFRGIIQNFFQAYMGIIFSILLSSVIFGLVHLPNGAKSFRPSGWNLKLAEFAFVAGLPLGLIFYLTNSLLLPTVLHTLFVVCMQLFLHENFMGERK